MSHSAPGHNPLNHLSKNGGSSSSSASGKGSKKSPPDATHKLNHHSGHSVTPPHAAPPSLEHSSVQQAIASSPPVGPHASSHSHAAAKPPVPAHGHAAAGHGTPAHAAVIHPIGTHGHTGRGSKPGTPPLPGHGYGMPAASAATAVPVPGPSFVTQTGVAPHKTATSQSMNSRMSAHQVDIMAVQMIKLQEDSFREWFTVYNSFSGLDRGKGPIIDSIPHSNRPEKPVTFASTMRIWKKASPSHPDGQHVDFDTTKAEAVLKKLVEEDPNLRNRFTD